MNKPKTILICSLAVVFSLVLVVNGITQQNPGSDTPYDESLYGPEETIVWTSPGEAKFNHYSHTSLGYSCDDCHFDIFDMVTGAAKEAGDFNHTAFSEGKYCGTCHDGSMVFGTTTSCGECHSAPLESTVFTYPVKAVLFDHNVHVDRGGISCEACHTEVFTMKQGSVEEAERKQMITEQGKREYLEQIHTRYCGSCHDGGQAFGYLTRCTVCHIGGKAYRELEGRPAEKWY